MWVKKIFNQRHEFPIIYARLDTKQLRTIVEIKMCGERSLISKYTEGSTMSMTQILNSTLMEEFLALLSMMATPMNQMYNLKDYFEGDEH